MLATGPACERSCGCSAPLALARQALLKWVAFGDALLELLLAAHARELPAAAAEAARRAVATASAAARTAGTRAPVARAAQGRELASPTPSPGSGAQGVSICFLPNIVATVLDATRQTPPFKRIERGSRRRALVHGGQAEPVARAAPPWEYSAESRAYATELSRSDVFVARDNAEWPTTGVESCHSKSGT
jgi:hypothetical protein